MEGAGMLAIRGALVPRGSEAGRRLIQCGALLMLALLSACAYNKKLETAVPLEPKSAIASASDVRLSARIDAVIVRDGPGSWSKNADWDEYLLHLRATSGWSLDITRVVVIDSLGKRHKPRAYMRELADESKETAKRYQDEDLEVTANAGAALFWTGYFVGGASAAAGLATLGTAGAAAGAAVGGLVVAPVLMTAGVVVAAQEYQVQREIDRRRTVLPLTLAAGQDLPATLFFPVAPSPQQVEITYTDPAGEHVLVIGTKDALVGLHLVPKEGEHPGDRPPP
jgi:hypothetical protein